MFEGWGEFYLLAGSAAAVLIGLIFVVVTLMQDRPRSSVLAGSKLYMGPVVLQVSFVLALSAAALVPGITRGAFAALAAVSRCGAGARGAVDRRHQRAQGRRRRAALDRPVVLRGDPELLYVALAAVAAVSGAGRGGRCTGSPRSSPPCCCSASATSGTW
jgi:hypothetical protein